MFVDNAIHTIFMSCFSMLLKNNSVFTTAGIDAIAFLDDIIVLVAWYLFIMDI